MPLAANRVAVWQEAPFFSDAERAALGLAEAITRLADRTDRVPDVPALPSPTCVSRSADRPSAR
jgi:alkylhydroperoxidase family enzyme